MENHRLLAAKKILPSSPRPIRKLSFFRLYRWLPQFPVKTDDFGGMKFFFRIEVVR